MTLNALQIRGFLPGETPYKKADERDLYLEVFPGGSKLWRLKYYSGGKEKRIALGAWPEVSLQAARKMRDELRVRIANGEDPSLTRKREKATAKISAANTFESVAQEYIDQKMVGEGRAEATLLKARWFLDLLKPAIGKMPKWLQRSRPRRTLIDHRAFQNRNLNQLQDGSHFRFTKKLATGSYSMLQGESS